MYKFLCSLIAILLAGLLLAGPAPAAPKKSSKIVPTAQQAVQAASESEKAATEKTETAVKQTATEAEEPAQTAEKDKPAVAKAAPETKTKAKTASKPPTQKTVAGKPNKGPLGLGGALSGSSQEPIKIISNRLVADDQNGTVIFTGKVKAVQGETTLYCDQLTVYYSKMQTKGASEQDAQRELTRIETEGHVKVVLPGQTAYGQKGIYQIAEGMIILQGRPKIVRGDNTLTGDKIIVYLNENKAVVEGGRQMVEAVIIPKTLNEPAPKPTIGADAGLGPASGIGTVSAGTN